MKLLEKIISQAKQNIQTIVLPEGKDQRIIDAARELKSQNVANVIVLINMADVNEETNKLQSEGIEVIVVENSDKLNAYSSMLVDLRKAKGMTKEEADKLILNTVYYGVMMVKNNDADGMVAGAITSTGDVLRPALQILRTAKNVKIVSSFFLMDVPNSISVKNNVFAFSDCGLVVNPNAEELSEIAIQTARSFDYLTQSEPRIAMLSYSTFGSASGEVVSKVVKATKNVQARYPNLKIDGELQLDAAIVPSVAKQKAPNSNVAGNANVLIFPDLQSGNIGYKLVERLANAAAYGPITQGLSRPVNDLSRGCSYEDIIAVVAITALQSQSYKNL
ncbi:MAG: Phosphate acetyltransferase [Candidatus Izimaplasma bacterium HR2]|nr:MAG: Phosphate acetyltransferase [Candidatus Izimaplasma bacterium HR2]